MLEHWNTSCLNVRNTHESECQSLQKWWLWSHVHSQANSSDQLLQLDEDRQRHTKESFDTKIEDKAHVHVPSFVICTLSGWSGVVGE